MPSLSRTWSGSTAQPQRLLVSEDQIRGCSARRTGRIVGARAHDPLEPGERLGVPRSACGGDVGQQFSGDDRGGDQRVRMLDAVELFEHVIAEQRTGLVTGQHAKSPVLLAHAERAAVRVRIERHGEIGADLIREGQEQVGRTGLLRVGEGDGREVAVGRRLLRYDVHIGDTREMQCPHEGLAADAVHRRGRHAQGGGGRTGVRELAGPVHVALQDVRRPCPRIVGVPRRVDADRGWRGGDRLLDPNIVGRHELCTAAQVDLHPVVLRRVVRRGDLHAGRRLQRPDRERGDRRGQGTGGEQHGKACRRKHSSHVGGELGRAVPGIVPDDDQRPAFSRRRQVRG